METSRKNSVHIIFTSIHFISAIITLIPMASASKASLLGYKALCSFSPISTAVFLALCGLHIYLHTKQAAGQMK